MKEKQLVLENNNEELAIQVKDNLSIGVMKSTFYKDIYNIVNYHWHKEFQFTLITKGEFIFEVYDKKYKLKEGQGLFINSKQIHKAYATHEGSSYVFIYFHPNILYSNTDSYIYKNFVYPILNNSIPSYLIEENSEILGLIEKAYNIYKNQEDYFELDLISIIFKIWKYHLEILNNKDFKSLIPDNVTGDRLREIIHYIEKNYKENITLEDISNHINLSPAECSRFFKRTLNRKLFDYILELRINKSIDLIINTSMPITEIAFECGFNSQSYFISKFKKLKSITPLQMRKNYKKSKEIFINSYCSEIKNPSK